MINGLKNADFGNKIAEIADHYGFDSQSHMLIEEMAELAQALNKLYRAQGKGQPTKESKKDTFLHLYEELADVEICIEQVVHLLECRDSVDAWKEKKVERQLERMEKENEENKLICELTGEQCPLGSYDDCLDDDECEAICDKYKCKGLYIGENGQRIISDECTHERVLQYDNWRISGFYRR